MKKITLTSEQSLISLGVNLAKALTFSKPVIIELLGDVGAGKTTFTRGLAQGLGIIEPVTSPSFTISKQYAFLHNSTECRLAHYDFYRLPDPGIMQEDLQENLISPHTLVVVEWANSVADLLPDDRTVVKITTLASDARQVEITGLSASMLKYIQENQV